MPVEDHPRRFRNRYLPLTFATPTQATAMGRGKAAESDGEYSSALREAGGTWTFEELNSFISDPSFTLPGTNMTFAGVQDEKQRADIIAYLRTLSDTPLPLPEN